MASSAGKAAVSARLFPSPTAAGSVPQDPQTAEGDFSVLLKQPPPSQAGGKRRKEQDFLKWSRKPPSKVHHVSPPATSWDAGGTVVHIAREISKSGQAHQSIAFGGW